MKTLLSTLLAAAVVAALPSLQAKVSQQTLDNLNAAFQGESNAAHRYTEFAAKAQAEGYSQAARLFRAAARAESVHLDNHRQAILALGGKVADFQLEAVTVGTTAENLQAAIKGESYERDNMYPGFLKTAREDKAKQAIRTLTFAQKAEAEHARLYQQVLDNLGKNTDAPLYVCKICGYTTAEVPRSRCANCRESARNYEEVI